MTSSTVEPSKLDKKGAMNKRKAKTNQNSIESVLQNNLSTKAYGGLVALQQINDAFKLDTDHLPEENLKKFQENLEDIQMNFLHASNNVTKDINKGRGTNLQRQKKNSKCIRLNNEQIEMMSSTVEPTKLDKKGATNKRKAKTNQNSIESVQKNSSTKAYGGLVAQQQINDAFKLDTDHLPEENLKTFQENLEDIQMNFLHESNNVTIDIHKERGTKLQKKKKSKHQTLSSKLNTLDRGQLYNSTLKNTQPNKKISMRNSVINSLQTVLNMPDVSNLKLQSNKFQFDAKSETVNSYIKGRKWGQQKINKELYNKLITGKKNVTKTFKKISQACQTIISQVDFAQENQVNGKEPQFRTIFSKSKSSQINNDNMLLQRKSEGFLSNLYPNTERSVCDEAKFVPYHYNSAPTLCNLGSEGSQCCVNNSFYQYCNPKQITVLQNKVLEEDEKFNLSTFNLLRPITVIGNNTTVVKEIVSSAQSPQICSETNFYRKNFVSELQNMCGFQTSTPQYDTKSLNTACGQIFSSSPMACESPLNLSWTMDIRNTSTPLQSPKHHTEFHDLTNNLQTSNCLHHVDAERHLTTSQANIDHVSSGTGDAQLINLNDVAKLRLTNEQNELTNYCFETNKKDLSKSEGFGSNYFKNDVDGNLNNQNCKNVVHRKPTLDQIYKSYHSFKKNYCVCLKKTIGNKCVSGRLIKNNINCEQYEQQMASLKSQRGILKMKRGLFRCEKQVKFKDNANMLEEINGDTSFVTESARLLENTCNQKDSRGGFVKQQLRSLDGPNDSSSSDEEIDIHCNERQDNKSPFKRCVKSQKIGMESPKYTALAVKIQSPRSLKKRKSPNFSQFDLQGVHPAGKELCSKPQRASDTLQNTKDISVNEKICDTIIYKETKSCDNFLIEKAKRKLSLVQLKRPPLDKTLVEESIACRLSSDKSIASRTRSCDNALRNISRNAQSNVCDKLQLSQNYNAEYNEDIIAQTQVEEIKNETQKTVNNLNPSIEISTDLNIPSSGIKIARHISENEGADDCFHSSGTSASQKSEDLFSDEGHKKTNKRNKKSVCFDKIVTVLNCDLFIENVNKTENFLSVSERYDLENDFVPGSGPSETLLKKSKKSPDYYELSGEEDYHVDCVEKNLEESSRSSSTSTDICGKTKPSSSQNSHDSSSTNQITPYQKPCQQNIEKKQDQDLSAFCQNLTVCDIIPCEGDVSLTSDGFLVLIPKYNPPSRELIKSSLDDCNIPLVRYQEPYYSNVIDVTGKVDVGSNVLQISSKTTADALEFECSVTSHGLTVQRKCMFSREEINNLMLKNSKLTLCPNTECTITPVINPPSYKDVEVWLEEQHWKKDVKKKPKIVKTKILLPSSPNAQNASDDDEDSITISPCTPVNDSISSSQSTVVSQETPKSSLKTSKPGSSPVLGEKSKKSRKLKGKSLAEDYSSTIVLNRSSAPSDNNGINVLSVRKKLLQSQFMNQLGSTVATLSNSYQVDGASLDNTYGFKRSLENLQTAKAVCEYQYLTLLVMELHVQTRGDFKPNPEFDPIRAIFYSILNDVPEDYHHCSKATGVVVVNSTSDGTAGNMSSILEGTGVTCDVIYADSEVALINEFLKLINFWDPDIFAGYEIQMLSWGYLIERGYILGMNLPPLLSRVPTDRKYNDDEDISELKLVGRIVLDVWRLMKHEIALQSYKFENVMYHILHQRVPLYSFKDLSFWWEHRVSVYRHRTINFYFSRTNGILKLLDNLDIVGRTSELARLFGIQFFEVLSRGSQFRVESMMLRLAKPLNFLAVSPSVQQRAKMRAPESLPLILEPESRFYTDPVIVLDFQSLYPSIIIAYNYCFSTCLGQVERLGDEEPFEFGATQLKISQVRVKKLLKKDLLNYSPCGVAFVKPRVRRGILPRMLEEILSTRLMVKKSMKENKDNKVLQRILYARQLGLKLIANVTYGYTAANFSGRMPAVELGDSVVSKARETLLRAIKLVENTPRWGAKVVYGDTDSLFVLVRGRSKEDTFKIGEEIAEAVTNDNPSPVKLKLEKVFHPCILQTKKRYVGYMYESASQTEPEFLAKGIETVRRDGCPAVSKMLEKCLKMLFENSDVSLIRKYVLRQFEKMIAGKVGIQDFTFAKEYRGATNYKPGACVPALELARKWKAYDKRSEPRSGERVPYVIINGPPGLPLIKLVRSPRDLLNDSSLRLNILYYITRVIIPPLNRCFTLIGADFHMWFNEMPRKHIQYLPSIGEAGSGKKSTISQYFSVINCASCNRPATDGLCDGCIGDSQKTAVVLNEKLRMWDYSYNSINTICKSCCESTDINCISLDCPVLYRRTQSHRDMQQSEFVRNLINRLPALEL